MRPEGVNFPNTPVCLSTDLAVALLRVRLQLHSLCPINHWVLS